MRKISLDARDGGIERRIVVAPRRQQDAITPAHQAARLDEAASLQRLPRNDDPWTKAYAGRDGVRFADKRGAQGKAGRTDSYLVSQDQVEACQENGIDDRAVNIPAWRKQLGNASRRVGRHLAEPRIVGAHGLELDEGGVARWGARHGAKRRDFTDLTQFVDGGALVDRSFALQQGEGDIAANDDAALRREPLAETTRDGADTSDGAGPDGKAGEEDAEAMRARNKIPPGDS